MPAWICTFSGFALLSSPCSTIVGKLAMSVFWAKFMPMLLLPCDAITKGSVPSALPKEVRANQASGTSACFVKGNSVPSMWVQLSTRATCYATCPMSCGWQWPNKFLGPIQCETIVECRRPFASCPLVMSLPRSTSPLQLSQFRAPHCSRWRTIRWRSRSQKCAESANDSQPVAEPGARNTVTTTQVSTSGSKVTQKPGESCASYSHCAAAPSVTNNIMHREVWQFRHDKKCTGRATQTIDDTGEITTGMAGLSVSTLQQGVCSKPCCSKA